MPHTARRLSEQGRLRFRFRHSRGRGTFPTRSRGASSTTLVKAGLIKTVRGARGGLMLALRSRRDHDARHSGGPAGAREHFGVRGGPCVLRQACGGAPTTRCGRGPTVFWARTSRRSPWKAFSRWARRNRWWAEALGKDAPAARASAGAPAGAGVRRAGDGGRAGGRGRAAGWSGRCRGRACLSGPNRTRRHRRVGPRGGLARAEFVEEVRAQGALHYRDLPWRNVDDAYAVLVSEIMLQQTQVARVAKYWERFLAAFPTLDALAAAEPAEVLELWQGLGYNRRALALKRAADVCAADFGGRLPETAEGADGPAGDRPRHGGGRDGVRAQPPGGCTWKRTCAPCSSTACSPNATAWPTARSCRWWPTRARPTTRARGTTRSWTSAPT